MVIHSAELLLPNTDDMQAWSVIACDQFTSDPGYWEQVESAAAGRPSTLNLILPEAWLGTPRADGAEMRIARTMEQYRTDGTLRCLEHSFLYVERTMTDGSIRHGLVAAVDLEQYDYYPESEALIKATEGTVQERLLKRLDLRLAAGLELPHALLFLSDPSDSLIGGLTEEKASLQKEYDFDLMLDGGHIAGWSISGERACRLEQQLAAMEQDAVAQAEKSGCSPVFLTVADGNHSLATAKLAWDTIKQTLSPEQREHHPARYALAEILNVYDSGISIQPIHRILSGTRTEEFLDFLAERIENLEIDLPEDETPRTVTVGIRDEYFAMTLCGRSVGSLIGAADRFLQEYIRQFGGQEDYIHDEASAVELGMREASAFVLLPTVRREDLFTAARAHRIFPKKSFSIGCAREKRYYLEARAIRE